MLILSLGSEAMAWDSCFCYKNQQPMVATQQMVTVPYYTYQVVPVYVPVIYYPVFQEYKVVTVQNVLVPAVSYVQTPVVNYPPVHRIYKY